MPILYQYGKIIIQLKYLIVTVAEKLLSLPSNPLLGHCMGELYQENTTT